MGSSWDQLGLMNLITGIAYSPTLLAICNVTFDLQVIGLLNISSEIYNIFYNSFILDKSTINIEQSTHLEL